MVVNLWDGCETVSGMVVDLSGMVVNLWDGCKTLSGMVVRLISGVVVKRSLGWL
jgi:hypothetical protein